MLLLSLSISIPVFASQDLSVSCTSSECNISPENVAMFNESNWVPGQSVSKVIDARNKTKEDALFAIEGEFEGSGRLSDALLISIKENIPNGKTIYEQTSLTSFVSNGFIPLTHIKKNGSEEYLVTVTFDPLAGNEFQGTDTQFSLTLGFGLVPEKKTDEVKLNDSAQKNEMESVKQCSAVSPSTAPVVSFASHSPNTVLLSWTSVSPVTHYVVSFRRQSDGAEYGSPNVGNVTSYTITNIPGDVSYSFSVFGVNDCMPGERGSTSGIPLGTLVLGKPEGEDKQMFLLKEDSLKQQVLSPNTQEPPTTDHKTDTGGFVLGTSTTDDDHTNLIFLIFYTIISFALSFLLRKKFLTLWIVGLTINFFIATSFGYVFSHVPFIYYVYIVLILCMQPLLRFKKNM